MLCHPGATTTEAKICQHFDWKGVASIDFDRIDRIAHLCASGS
jgi:hypothetical protein